MKQVNHKITLHIINNQTHARHTASPEFNIQRLNHRSETATCLVQIVVTGL